MTDDAPDPDATPLGEAATQLLHPPTVAETHSQGGVEPATPPPDAAGVRYRLGEELGRGGAGRVIAAQDLEIGRAVAMKTMRAGPTANRDELRRFLDEARVTGQLEHPGVIPVHDLGLLADGQPFYTMRVVKRRSLREVLLMPAPRPEWPLGRLASMFVQVCRAMAYAHARGVVHRDLKPDNILLGDYGEVYVADWGIAKLVDAPAVDPPRSTREAPIDGTAAGAVLGTPGYLPPEQARGEWDTLDHRADLFALGAILYEILADRRPFDGDSWIAIIEATLTCDPVPPRELAPFCPLVLDDLCLKMLAKDKHDRPASAEAVAAEVEAFLEGAKEKARRRQEARRLVDRAAEPVARYHRLGGERERHALAARALLREVAPWEPVERKRPGWALEDRAADAQAEQARALAEAIELYSQARGHDPESEPARAGLADLYWARAREAELARREPTRIYYESLVRDLDDGRYAAQMSADARLSLRTHPPGAEVIAYRYVEHDRILRAVDPRPLPRTPFGEVSLPPGSWMLVIRHPGYRDTRYPVLCRRGEHHDGVVTLYTGAEIGDGFVHVPAGRCTIGGDDDAFQALPREQPLVDDFAIARLPVTFDDYLEFLNDLQARDPAAVERRLPRDDYGEGPSVRRDDRGVWTPVYEILVDADGRAYCAPDEVGQIPIIPLNWFDAMAYAAWRAARDGVPYRLLRELEWEKAARGVDGRLFPWGDRFDPTFAKMKDSRPGFQPEPVGRFAADESPYGVRDLAGGMRTWVADIHGELSVEAAVQPEPPPGSPREAAGNRVQRGGAWLSSRQFCRSASRHIYYATWRNGDTGVRLGKSLPKRR